jgi:argininosuccinate lyase
MAGLVREAVESGTPFGEVVVRDLGEDAGAVLEQSSWLESKVSEGGTALPRVREQLEQARALLDR